MEPYFYFLNQTKLRYLKTELILGKNIKSLIIEWKITQHTETSNFTVLP